MTKISVLLFVCVITVISCENFKVTHNLQQMTGKEILLPKTLRGMMHGKDTISSGFTDAPVKLVVWYDSLVCASCKINNMIEWREIITTSIGLKHKFNVVFIFSPMEKDEYKAISILKYNRLNYPVFIDHGSQFQKLNPVIPSKEAYHTFLLDKDNRVLLVGNPLDNDALWELYKKEIRKRIEVLK